MPDIEELQTIESPLNLTLICRCSKCGVEKELNRENFNVNSKEKNGFSKWCKVCKKTANQKRYSEKKEFIINSNKKWSKNNLHKVVVYQRRWKKRHDKQVKIQKCIDAEIARNALKTDIKTSTPTSTDTILQ